MKTILFVFWLLETLASVRHRVRMFFSPTYRRNYRKAVALQKEQDEQDEIYGTD